MDIFTYYLFDWDGCLANSLQVWLTAYQKTFNIYGSNPSLVEIAHNVLGKITIPKEYAISDNDLFRKQLLDNVNKDIGSAALNDGVEETILKLKSAGKLIAIVSSSRKAFIHSVLDQTKIAHCFDFIIDGEDVVNLKPDPESVIKAMEKFGAKKEEAVMIGDSDKDVGAGKNAGIATILYYPQDHTQFYSEEHVKALEPTFVIKNFSELLG